MRQRAVFNTEMLKMEVKNGVSNSAGLMGGGARVTLAPTEPEGGTPSISRDSLRDVVSGEAVQVQSLAGVTDGGACAAMKVEADRMAKLHEAAAGESAAAGWSVRTGVYGSSLHVRYCAKKVGLY